MTKNLILSYFTAKKSTDVKEVKHTGTIIGVAVCNRLYIKYFYSNLNKQNSH